MPARPTLPRNAKCLPKGTNKHDYDPEVYAEWLRDRLRQKKSRQRNRQRHRGYRDVTFNLSKVARDNLKRLSKELGMSKSKLLNQLLEQYHVQQHKTENREDAGNDQHPAP